MECHEGEWSLSALHAHLEALMTEKDKRDEQRFREQQRAIERTAEDTTKRFDGANEIKGAMQDQQRTLMPREEYRVQHDGLVERLNAVELRMAALVSRPEAEQQHAAIAKRIDDEVLARQQTDRTVGNLWVKFAAALAFMTIIGGTVGAAIIKALGG